MPLVVRNEVTKASNKGITPRNVPILDFSLPLEFPHGLLAPGVAEGRIYTTFAIHPFFITGMSWSQSEARLILVETSPSPASP
jgi:hypothetical protein